MTRTLLAIALVLTACGAQQHPCQSARTRADAMLFVGSGAIMVGTAVAVDPVGVVDSREKRQARTDVELALGLVALSSIAMVHEAGTCKENEQ